MKSICVIVASVTTSFLCLPAHADCPGRDGAAFIGAYDFTTVVLGANSSNAIGVNGYYRMIVAADGCALKVGIGKLGFSGKMFPPNNVQIGVTDGSVYQVESSWIGPEQALFVDAELASGAGTKLSVGFTFSKGIGIWRYLGDSWASAGMWGGLTYSQATSEKAPFSGPLKLSCSSEKLETDAPVGVAVVCRDLVLANSKLNRILRIIPTDSPGDQFQRLAGTGRLGTRAYVDYCTEYSVDHESEANGSRGAFRLLTDGNRVIEGTPDGSTLRKCRVTSASKPAPAKDRWEGGIK